MKKMFASSLCIVALCGAGLAMAIEFTWSGSGSGNSWATHTNWCFGFGCPIGYPDDTGDNATIPNNSGTTWTVTQTAETIGDLTIEENVDFDGTVTLTVEKLTISGDGAEIAVTTAANGEIRIQR